MAKIQCKMCGGNLELPPEISSGECPFCGTLITLPKIADERTEQLYNRAEHFRQISEFDKAVSTYEELIQQGTEDPEMYWGLVLSRFGIEYVEDPASHERIPTCHRVQFDSILADSDYLQALELSSGQEHDIYEAQAKRIAEIQKDILAVSAQEEPYDVFICYKETTDGGTRTHDSLDAQDIYYQLTNAGYKVFFARVTLEDKLGTQYEPHIFAALNSAKVMLVIGSQKEYFEAVWVRNEWSRFLALMKKDRSKMLIPCYKGMDPYNLPQELSMLQSQDMSKIGFVQDLLRGIDKVIGKNTVAANIKNAAAQNGLSSLLKRARMFLIDQDWTSAGEYCTKVLDQDPENGEAYLLQLLMEYRISAEDRLFALTADFSHSRNFQRALQYGDDRIKTALTQAKEDQQSEKIYVRLTNRLNQLLTSSDLNNISELEDRLELTKTILKYRDTEELSKKISEHVEKLRNILQNKFAGLCTKYNEAQTENALLALIPEFQELEQFGIEEAVAYRGCCKKSAFLYRIQQIMGEVSTTTDPTRLEELVGELNKLDFMEDAGSLAQQTQQKLDKILAIRMQERQQEIYEEVIGNLRHCRIARARQLLLKRIPDHPGAQKCLKWIRIIRISRVVALSLLVICCICCIVALCCMAV